MTRLSPEGTSPHGARGWYPEQRLTREEGTSPPLSPFTFLLNHLFLSALQGMTANAAFASFQENSVGRIVKGLRADLTILSQDIMTVPQEEILGSKVVATLLDGRVVYGGLNI